MVLSGYSTQTSQAAPGDTICTFSTTGTMTEDYGALSIWDTLDINLVLNTSSPVGEGMIEIVDPNGETATSTPNQINVFNNSFGGTTDAIGIGSDQVMWGLGGILFFAPTSNITFDLRGDTSIIDSTDIPTLVQTWNNFPQRTLWLPDPNNISATTGVATFWDFSGSCDIEWPPAPTIDFDIKPRSCVNNKVDLNTLEELNTVIFGDWVLDLSTIDLNSLALEWISPVLIRRNADKQRKQPDDCILHAEDGIDDMQLKFDVNELQGVLWNPNVGDVITLTLQGRLLDGTAFSAQDIITIK